MNKMSDTYAPRNERFFHLIGDLQSDLKTYIKKEIELAKTEMSEKFGSLGKNAAFGAAGGVLGLMAAFMLLIGLGALVAQLLQQAGLSPGMAYFLSYLGLSLILGGVGYFLIQKAIHAFSELSLAPEKAIATAKGEEVPIHVKTVEKKENTTPKRSSDEVKTEAETARIRMDNELAEIKSRLTPAYVGKSFIAGIKHHPIRALLVGSSTALGGYLYWRNRHMVEVRRLNAQRKWWQFKVRHA